MEWARPVYRQWRAYKQTEVDQTEHHTTEKLAGQFVNKIQWIKREWFEIRKRAAVLKDNSVRQTEMLLRNETWMKCIAFGFTLALINQSSVTYRFTLSVFWIDNRIYT